MPAITTHNYCRDGHHKCEDGNNILALGDQSSNINNVWVKGQRHFAIYNFICADSDDEDDDNDDDDDEDEDGGDQK